MQTTEESSPFLFSSIEWWQELRLTFGSGRSQQVELQGSSSSPRLPAPGLGKATPVDPAWFDDAELVVLNSERAGVVKRLRMDWLTGMMTNYRAGMTVMASI